MDLVIETFANGVMRCTECGATLTVSEQAAQRDFRHSRRCESRPSPAYAAPVAAAEPVAIDARTRGERTDDFHAINSRNPKDWARAMNRDD